MNTDPRSNQCGRHTLAAKRPLAAWMLAAAGTCAIMGATEASPFVPRVAGTWEIVGTPEANPCGVNEPFSGIATIAFDGTLTTIDPLSGRTALGEVFQLGLDEYGIGFFGFLSPAPQVLFRFEVQATLEQTDRDSASGQFRTRLTDPAGMAPDCVYEGTIVGQRLVPMPF